MNKKKIQNKPLSRKDISNPFHAIPHDELRRKAGITNRAGDNYEVVRFDEKRLVIKPINSNKKHRRKS
jgi:hypothetical protein